MSGSPRGLKINNPGNIRQLPGDVILYKGQVKSSDPAFMEFSAMKYGFRAMASLLYNYIHSKGLNTIGKIINTYAPAADKNNPVSYAAFVAKNSGVSGTEILTKEDFLQPNGDPNIKKIMRWMARVEQGQMPNEADLQEGYDLFLTDQNLA
jgi:hypothetical protein